MIEFETPIARLTAAIEATDVALRRKDAGYNDGDAAGRWATTIAALSNIPVRPEVTDARDMLTTLKAAAAKYVSRWSTTKGSIDTWLANYTTVFTLLDLHARYVLSLTTMEPAALAFGPDQTTHDALLARVEAAAASEAPSNAKAHLSTYRARFDVTWKVKPARTVGAGADSSAEGLSLSAAIANAMETIDFLAWRKANP